MEPQVGSLRWLVLEDYGEIIGVFGGVSSEGGVIVDEFVVNVSHSFGIVIGENIESYMGKRVGLLRMDSDDYRIRIIP